MPRYIDAEVLKSRLEDFSRWCKDRRKEGVDFILDCPLPDIPTADVAPVVHGRWIDKGEYAVCMECGGRSSTQYNGVEPIPLMTQFCPNCGAKMDGGVNNA